MQSSYVLWIRRRLTTVSGGWTVNIATLIYGHEVQIKTQRMRSRNKAMEMGFLRWVVRLQVEPLLLCIERRRDSLGIKFKQPFVGFQGPLPLEENQGQSQTSLEGLCILSCLGMP